MTPLTLGCLQCHLDVSSMRELPTLPVLLYRADHLPHRQRLQIPVLPSIVTAALLTTIVSGGNAVSSC
jgi:hypothetical protein